jgi:hypothetical protein
MYLFNSTCIGVLKQILFILFYFMAANRYEVDEKRLQAYHRQLGERIRQLRKSKGYKNHESFAYDHGFARAQFGNYERGSGMSFSTIVKIAAAMEMTLAEFFSEGFDHPQE